MDLSKFSAKSGMQSLTIQVSAEDAPYISTTSNKGNIRVNQEAAEILGVNYELVNTESKDDPGVRIEFGLKEWAGKNEKVVVLLPNGTKDGAKLASPSRIKGGPLQCSSTNAWTKLDGNDEMLKWYTISSEDNGVLFSDDEVMTLAQCEEAGLVENGKWTQLAQEHNFGTAGVDVPVYYKLTYNKETPKRVTAEAGTKKAADKGTVEKPFANADQGADQDGAEDSADDAGDDDGFM